MDEIDQKLSRIKESYRTFEQALKETGTGLVYRTEKGIYGTTDIEIIFRFFKDIHLERYNHFCDLGCGDGRVVLVASLFTRATGIEFNRNLSDVAIETRNRLGLDCEFIVGDYLEQDLTKYDVVFINPDHEFKELDQKLRRELNGPLFIYNEIFAPKGLKKGKKFWYDQKPIIMFTRE